MLLVIEAMLALIVTAGIMMGDIYSWNTLMCWTLTFCVFFCLFAPAWQFKKEKDSHFLCHKPNCKKCKGYC